MVTIPYMKGVSEAVEHMLRRHGIATAVRPYKTLATFGPSKGQKICPGICRSSLFHPYVPHGTYRRDW